jgi:hypothetical protein
MKTLKELRCYRYKPKISIANSGKQRNRRTYHQTVHTIRRMVHKPRIYRSAPINWAALAPKMPPIETYYVPRKKCTTKTQPPSNSKS